MLEIISVPCLVVATCAIIEMLKGIFKNNDKFNRLIPLIALLIGAIGGIILFYAAPSIMPADNLFMAIITGAVSGLGAVGCNQVAKQLKKEDTPKSESETKTEE